MNKKIDKAALASRIHALEGLSSKDKSALLELLSEQKRYGLVWEDSPEEVEALLREKLPVLKEDTSKRILADTTDEVPNHILIEGDNYPALVALQYAYEGKVDVIYIDPPYNTGNKDFVYNDSYVDSEDSYRHSKWLSFMSKRLRIAKRLLSDRGVIFISIDDNEQANLKLLCDEVFGNENIIACICRQAIKGGSKAGNIKTVHDYVLIYSKNLNYTHPFTGVPKEDIELELEDDLGSYTKGRELNKWGAGSRREDSPTMWFPIPGPHGEDVYPIRTDGSEGRWRWGKAKLMEAVSKNDVIFEKRENGIYTVYEKVRGLKNTTTEYTTWFADNYINAKGSEALKRIFCTLMSVFDYAKPVELIRDFIYCVDIKDSTILDFFAGSGTTLHATMQLNAEDGGQRQCILVTNNENNICEEVTYERNKRVIQGYTTPKGQQVEGLKNNNLRYYKVDFVDREKTATNQKELMKASTDLLCIKENLYQEETSFEGLKLHPQIARYFTDGVIGGSQMLVIYKPDAIPVIVKRIEQMTVVESNPIKVYVMAEGQYPYTEDFESVLSKIELRAMPHALYQAMRQVLPPPAEAENTEPDMEVSDEEADGSIYKSEEL